MHIRLWREGLRGRFALGSDLSGSLPRFPTLRALVDHYMVLFLWPIDPFLELESQVHAFPTLTGEELLLRYPVLNFPHATSSCTIF